MVVQAVFSEEEYQTLKDALAVARESRFQDLKCSDVGSEGERAAGRDVNRFGELLHRMTDNSCISVTKYV